MKVVFGLDPRRYMEDLHAHARAGTRGILSLGVAGGLSPHLQSGDVVVASAVHTAGGSFRTCEAWSATLLAALPPAQIRTAADYLELIRTWLVRQNT